MEDLDRCETSTDSSHETVTRPTSKAGQLDANVQHSNIVNDNSQAFLGYPWVPFSEVACKIYGVFTHGESCLRVDSANGVKKYLFLNFIVLAQRDECHVLGRKCSPECARPKNS